MTDLAFSYIQRAGAQRFVPYTYIGYRYLEIDDPGETIDSDQVVSLTRHCTMPDSPAATFSSSNALLDQLFALMAHSCEFCSHEQFIDTPTREKGPFLWDGAQESQAVMRLFLEQNLSFQGLRDFARSQARFHPDGRMNAIYPNSDGARDYPTFTAIYVEWLWRYFINTGDKQTLGELYLVALKVGQYFSGYLDPSTNLLTGLQQQNGGEQAFGYDFNVVTDTAINVLAFNVFTKLAAIGTVLGDHGGASTLAARAASLQRAINAHLTRPDGIYIDGLEPNGAPSTHASQQANALALAYGVVPPARVAAVGAFVLSLGIAVGPDHGFELLEALHTASLDSEVVHTLTNTAVPGWAQNMRDGGTFTWETWTPNDLIGDSMSHGWGSSALVAMQEALVGVTLTTPPGTGTTALAVQVPAAGLSEVRGATPTIAGPVTSHWRRTPGQTQLELVIPANVTAQVKMPATSLDDLTEGGHPAHASEGVSVLGFANGSVSLRVGSGTYRFASST
jgi:alpha-L-rhamnosidase